MATQNQSSNAASPFPVTHWSLVLQAGQQETRQSREALEQLCGAYWYPLYAFARKFGHSPPDAEDATQAFFAHLIETRMVGKADRSLGRFRSFLLASFRNFIAVERGRAQTQKRGGGQVTISLDDEGAEERFHREPATDANPETIFERSWAMTVLDQAFAVMEQEFNAAGRQPLFDQLCPFLQGDHGVLTYADAARNLGTTEGTIKVTVSRMRGRYREILRSIVSRTVATPEEVEEELRHLVSILRG